MADNNSLGGGDKRGNISSVIFVQVLVTVFLCINFFLIATFSTRHYFYTTMRYILFANSLVSDSVILIVTNLLLILIFLKHTIPVPLCLFFFVLSSLYTFVTPITLTVMSMERYVAICLPLRHAELCSTQRAFYCILIIHCVSSLIFVITLILLSASVTWTFFEQKRLCTADIFVITKWQTHLKWAINQSYFLVMCCTIVFCYIRIMRVARAASGQSKESTSKGQKTVVLHAFQLLLCLIQLWCPFIEAAVLQIDIMLYVHVRYFNYIMFYLAPRCLSPLIYGLRDDKFFLALKYYALCGLFRNTSLDLSL